MWICPRCREKVEDQFDSCWSCSTCRPGPSNADSDGPMTGANWAANPRKRVEYKKFRGTWSSWDDLFAQAADYATELGPARLIGISHSCDHSDGVVTVWYWTD